MSSSMAVAGRLGPIQLREGVSTTNGVTLLFAAFFSVCLLAFINFGQPYLLRVNLGVPEGAEGQLTGLITVTQELVVLLLVAPFGILSDRIGRRPVYAFGFAVLGIGYGLIAFATTVPTLIACRMVFAVGAAAVGTMLAVVPADYPREVSRGKLLGAVGVCNGLGMAIVVPLLGMLPGVFESAGADPVSAGRFGFGVAALVCFLSALVVGTGLQPGVPANTSARASFLSLLKQGFTAAKNPRVALAYGSAFASRGDMIVVGAFFSLWVTRVGIRQGHTDAEALQTASLMFVLVQISALCWAPIMGIIADRMNRVASLVFAMALASIGYLGLGFVNDPISSIGMIASVALGVGQMSAIIASQALIGQEAQAEFRGSILGMYSFFGAVGLMLTSLVGGELFDRWTESGPFIMVGLMNLILLVWGAVVWVTNPGISTAKPAMATTPES